MVKWKKKHNFEIYERRSINLLINKSILVIFLMIKRNKQKTESLEYKKENQLIGYQ